MVDRTNYCPSCKGYADRIAALEAANARLREALNRIAEGDMPEYKLDGTHWWFDGGAGFYQWATMFAEETLSQGLA